MVANARSSFALPLAAGAAAGLPLWSATKRAEARLRRTSWQAGTRLVDDRGVPVRRHDLDPGAFTTVWPEGHRDEGNAQVVLIRLPADRSVSGPGRSEWLAAGHVAYSKICTHMGCPVGLYQARTDLLVCPCHQATFDILRGAAPVHGPAHRPLPQLPLAVDGDGYLIATGDFPEPVGPGYWSRPS
ncbi:MAG: Rieske (2Fe-2S) protein [Actinomycetota bacterium]|nr:Rieske (2Fe-2S) protein [Actinomycetota bacterium]